MKKMFKRFIALTLVLCMALSMGVTVFATNGGSSSSSGSGSSNIFIDVHADDYFAQAVIWGRMSNIINGKEPYKFCPHDTCTRAEIVMMLYRLVGCPQTSGSIPFKDVSKSDWYYKAIGWAYKKGIVNGTTATTFSPNEKCTRAQAATFLWKLADPNLSYATNKFSDVNPSDYFYRAVMWNLSKGIVNGTSPTTFSPNQNCTRAQIITMLYRFANWKQ